jgi:polysaccharide export outer membrane protein
VQGDKTLLEVLGMAGGLNREAGNMLEVTRRTSNGLRTHYVELDRLMREGDLRFNIPLRPGDVITVPKASVFFVAGSVNKPGAYPIRTGLTLTQAVATAGGPDQRLARAGKTALVRPGPNGERLKFKFNLGDIESGKVADPQIYENDIVIVPMNHAKYMMEMLLGRVGVGFSAPLVK